MQYDNKKVVTILCLIGNKLLTRYPCPIEILYDWGSELLGHVFKSLYSPWIWKKTKTRNIGNFPSWFYNRKNSLCNSKFNMDIQLTEKLYRWIWYFKCNPHYRSFAVHSICHRINGESPGHIVFGHNMIFIHNTQWIGN